MGNDFDPDLTFAQWEALKALRGPMTHDRVRRNHGFQQLVTLGLVEDRDGMPVITASGRKVLVRGSCRLLDLAA